MRNNEAESTGEERDQDLENLKQEMAKMTPAEQFSLRLAEVVDPEEMAETTGREETELADRRRILAEDLETFQDKDPISSEQELVAKLLGEFLGLRKQSKEAGEERKTYEKAGSAIKDIAIGLLATLTTGTVGEMLLGWDGRRARKGKSSVFSRKSHQDIAGIQRKVKRVVIAVFCPEALPFLHGAEKLREVVDSVDEKNDRRIKEGKDPLTLSERLGEYAEAVPEGFFEDPKNVELIGQTVGSIGQGVGGDMGERIGKIGTEIIENPELAGTFLEGVKNGKLNLNQADVSILAQVAMGERWKRKQTNKQAVGGGVEIIGETVEKSLEELEKDKAGLTVELNNVVRKQNEINGRLAQYDGKIAKDNQVVVQDEQRIQLEQAKLDLILKRDKLETERTILEGKKVLLYERIMVIDLSIAAAGNKGEQGQQEERQIKEAA